MWDEVPKKLANDVQQMTLGDGLVLRVERHSRKRTEWHVSLRLRYTDSLMELREMGIHHWPLYDIEAIEDAMPAACQLLKKWLKDMFVLL